MLNLRGINRDSVSITFGFDTLYGLKYEGVSEGVHTADLDKIRAVLKRARTSGKRDNIFTLVVKKSPVKCYPSDFHSAYRTEIFIFTFSELLAREFSGALPNYRLMSGVELANSLFRVHTLTDEYYFTGKIVENRNLPVFTEDTVFVPELPRPFSSIPVLSPPVGKSYPSYWKNEVEKARREGKFPFLVYKSPVISGMAPDLTVLASLEWSGAFFFRFNFNNVYGLLKSRASIFSSERERNFWKRISEEYKEGTVDLAVEEVTFITREESLPVIELFSALGMSPLEWDFRSKKVIEDTPLLWAEDTFEVVVGPEKVASTIPVRILKTKQVDSVDTVYGRSACGEFVSYSFFEEGQSPHVLIIAPTRSGKSFLLQKLAVELMQVDPEKLWNGEEADRDIPVFIRWFDVGFSAEFLVRLMKERGYPVEVISPYPDVKVNPFEIEKEEDIDSSITVVNLILESRKEEPLKGAEDTALRQVLLFWLLHREEINPWLLEEVSFLKEEYPEIYRDLKEKGYSDYTKIEEVVSLYPMFKYPRTVDIIRIARELKKNLPESAVDERKALEGLIRKLNVVAGIKNFRYWSSFTTGKQKLIYFDLSFIKETTYFVPLYYAIFTKVLRDMKRLPVNSRKFLFSDEFHNITKYRLFADSYDVLIREAAKFNIHLFMVTQFPKDVTPEIATSVGTKIFLKPAVDTGSSDSPSKQFEEELKSYYRLTDEVVRAYTSLPKYTALFVYPGGYFTFQAPLKKVELTLYESRKITEIETPDGIRIRKSYVLEE